MTHVFAETNWIVDVAGPRHWRSPAAQELLERSRRGEITLHVPACCFIEARRVIPERFKPPQEVELIRNFLGIAREDGYLAADDWTRMDQVRRRFESGFQNEINRLDATLEALRATQNLDVFALNDRMLDTTVGLSFRKLALHPFDQAVLGGVLGRVTDLRDVQPNARFIFCELDRDLQPWDRIGKRKEPLASVYDEWGIWVAGTFDKDGMEPKDWWLEKMAEGGS